MRRVDLGGVSFREVLDVLAQRIDPFFLTLHSFSLLRFNKSRTRFTPEPGYIERLRRFCTVARDQWGYRTLTALEAVTEMENLPDAALPWTRPPTTRALSSAAGILKSVRGRLMAIAQ